MSLRLFLLGSSSAVIFPSAALSGGNINDPRLEQAYSAGVVVGDYAGKQFRAECPLGDHAAAKKYTADLRWVLSEMVDKYRAEGENDNWLAAWAGGVVTALVPHAIAWNYG